MKLKGSMCAMASVVALGVSSPAFAAPPAILTGQPDCVSIGETTVQCISISGQRILGNHIDFFKGRIVVETFRNGVATGPGNFTQEIRELFVQSNESGQLVHRLKETLAFQNGGLNCSVAFDIVEVPSGFKKTVIDQACDPA